MVGVLLLLASSFALLATKYPSFKTFITEFKGAATGLMTLLGFVTGVLGLKREAKKPPRGKRRKQSSFEPRVSRSTFSFEGGVFGGLIGGAIAGVIIGAAEYLATRDTGEGSRGAPCSPGGPPVHGVDKRGEAGARGLRPLPAGAPFGSG